ncbi:MAG: permease [Actinomycetota bacterium]|nr:permease [Actinomycetota bacterium]
MGERLGAVAERAGTSRSVPSGAREPLVTKRTVVGIAIFLAVLAFFLTQTRLEASLGKLKVADRATTAGNRTAFSQFVDPLDYPPPLRWIAYGVNLWDANAIGMFFAILLGGAAVGAFTPIAGLRGLLRRRGAGGAGVGGVMGLPLFMCSACSAPVSMGFYRNGAALETSLGMILGSALFNPVGIVAIFLLFSAPMALARVAFGLVAILVLAPLVARWHQRAPAVVGVDLCAVAPSGPAEPGPPASAGVPDEPDSWGRAVRRGVGDWVSNTLDIAWRLVPPMLLASFMVGVVFTLIPPQQLSDRVGTGLLAVVVTAALGTLLQLPTLFEIPLVLGVLALGLGEGPATALLVTAPSAGLVTLGITRTDLGWRTPGLLLAGTFAGGVVAGVAVGGL